MKSILDMGFLYEDQTYLKIIWTIVSLILIVIVIRLINRILYAKIESNNKYYVLRKRVYYFFSSLFIIITIFIWSDSTVNLTTYFGLVSAGVAIALKDLFSNIAAWFFIIIRRPFQVSDRIMINGQGGDVIDIRMFQFTLMEISSYEDGEQSTGRIISIPNHYVFTHTLTNYNKGFKYLWNEIKVVITFESDWKRAKEILMQISEKHSLHLSEKAQQMLKQAKRKYMIHYNNLTPIVYTDVKDSGVQLTMRYLCVPRQRRNTMNDIWEDVLYEFSNEKNIQLAYPTIRVSQN